MKTFYEVAEVGGVLNNSLLLDNPKHKIDNLRWCRFKTYEEARKRVDKAIQDRKNQFFYFEDKQHNVKKKISYYERYKITYKIYKIVENEEIVFSCNNDDIELKENNDTSLQEFTTM